MVKILVVMLLVLSNSGCNSIDDSQFVKFPKLINKSLPDSIQGILDSALFTKLVNPVFLGKFKYESIIDISSPIIDTNDILYGNKKYSNNFLSDSFSILVDYTANIRFNSHYKNLKYFKHIPKTFFYYPIYFLNQSKKDLIFPVKDNYAFGIQEAINPKDRKWHPIEFIGPDFCGNGYLDLVVHQGEFVIVLMKKYFGETKSKLRVRFRLKDKIFVSDEFLGNINKNQFIIEERMIEYLRKSNSNKIDWIFLGGNIDKGQLN